MTLGRSPECQALVPTSPSHPGEKMLWKVLRLAPSSGLMIPTYFKLVEVFPQSPSAIRLSSQAQHQRPLPGTLTLQSWALVVTNGPEARTLY